LRVSVGRGVRNLRKFAYQSWNRRKRAPAVLQVKIVTDGDNATHLRDEPANERRLIVPAPEPLHGEPNNRFGLVIGALCQAVGVFFEPVCQFCVGVVLSQGNESRLTP
jgi:hypothetical protein